MSKFLWLILTVVLVFARANVSRAAPILVMTDSGNIGNYTFTNTAMSGNTATISMAVSRPDGVSVSTVDTVNGVTVNPEPTQLSTPFTFQVTPTGGAGQYSVNLPAGITQTIGSTPGQQAILGVNITQGTVPVGQSNFFNVSGPVTRVLANANPNYDFSRFGSLGALLHTTFTATTFTGGATSFESLFSTVGATATGNGSFSQQAQIAVPEPQSLVSLGLGLIVVLTTVTVWRR